MKSDFHFYKIDFYYKFLIFSWLQQNITSIRFLPFIVSFFPSSIFILILKQFENNFNFILFFHTIL